MKDKWMFLSTEEVEKKLNTSAASGLTRKAARSRLQKAGENAFFLLPHTSAADCVREILRQPSVVLLLILSGLLMVFEQPAQGKTVFALTVLYSLCLILLRLWSGRVYRIPAKTARPQIRVIREGQMFLLDCTRLVPGDLIELEQGDIAPCDLRLITVSNLRVLTYLGKSKGDDRYIRTLKNADEQLSPQCANDISLHTNMLYGGSVIEQGNARALVVETGKHTYIGALQGGVALKTAQTLPGTAQKMKKIASYLQIALLLAILPILCLCLLIGKNQEGIPMLFSTLLCLCLANPGGHMSIVLDIGMTFGIHRAITSNSQKESALIKTEKNPDQITDIDILFLLGPQAFSEHPNMGIPNGKQPATLSREWEDAVRRRELEVALGENFLSSREDLLQQLQQAGIQTVLMIEEESRQAITYIMRTGVAQTPEQIALASRFRAKNIPITAGWGKYSAYCGFSTEELRYLAISLQKQQKKLAILGNLPRESALLKQADVRFTCVDDLSIFTDSNRAREKKPQISRGREDVATQRMRQHADVLIPCADRHRGGLSSIVHTLYTASDTSRNLTALARYLIYSQLIRMTLILPTMLAGIHMIRPVQVLFSGLCLDLLLSWLLVSRTGVRVPTRIRETTSRASRILTSVEAVAVGVLTLVTFLFIHHHNPDPTAATSALFTSILLIQITSFLLHWNPMESLRVAINRKNLLAAIVIGLVFIPLSWIFGWMPQLGLQMVSTPYSYLALIGPLSVILVAVVAKIYQIGRSH